MVIRGRVYETQHVISCLPPSCGLAEVLVESTGQDVTEAFEGAPHTDLDMAKEKLKQCALGEFVEVSWGRGREREEGEGEREREREREREGERERGRE